MTVSADPEPVAAEPVAIGSQPGVAAVIGRL